jgi:hypothetical protein
MRLSFWCDDGDDAGKPDALLFEGTAHLVEGKGWAALIDVSTFHHQSDEEVT